MNTPRRRRFMGMSPEEASDHVQLRLLGGCEVDMKACMFRQPRLNVRMFLRGVVFYDQV